MVKTTSEGNLFYGYYNLLKLLKNYHFLRKYLVALRLRDLPVGRPAKHSNTDQFWKGHIAAWKVGKLSQADYCALHNLSKSSFSKWKSKLHPKLKGARKRYVVKSRYYKFAKLPDEKIELLMRWFLRGIPVKKSAQYFGVSRDSAYKFYNDFRLAVIDGALLYPQLFFGVGPVLTLGPVSDMNYVLRYIGTVFPDVRNREYKYSKETILRSKIQIFYKTLLFNTFFKWDEGEVFLFRNMGFQIFYAFVYSAHHNLDSQDWNEQRLLQLANEFQLTHIARFNWEHWAEMREGVSFLPENNWKAIYKDREMRLPDDMWLKTMLGDLKWVMRKHKKHDTRNPRSSYWDEFYPNQSAIQKALQNLNEKALQIESGN